MKSFFISKILLFRNLIFPFLLRFTNASLYFVYFIWQLTIFIGRNIIIFFVLFSAISDSKNSFCCIVNILSIFFYFSWIFIPSFSVFSVLIKIYPSLLSLHCRLCKMGTVCYHLLTKFLLNKYFNVCR